MKFIDFSRGVLLYSVISLRNARMRELNMQTIHTNFNLTDTKTTKVTEVGIGLEELGNAVLERVKEVDQDQKIHIATAILARVTLEDFKKRSLCIAHSMYTPFQLNKLSFIFGRILEVKHYKKDTAYIRCEYYSNGKIRTDIFLAPVYLYECDKPSFEGTEEYLIATCIRKEYLVKERGKYNKRTRRVYASEKEPIFKAKTRVVNGAILQVS